MNTRQIAALFAFAATYHYLPAATIGGVASQSPYFSYSNLPGLGGVLSGTLAGIGDTADTPLKRTALILSFATNDVWRNTASSPNSTISLKLAISSTENGGAPGLINLAILDVGRDLGSSNIHFAWLQAPRYSNLGPIVSPNEINSIQIFDVTAQIKGYLQNLDFQKSGICFGLFVPTPSDNGIKNASSVEIESAVLDVSSVSPSVAEVSIGSAVYLEFTSVAGSTYYVEYSNDLNSWTREPSGIAGDGTLKRKFYPLTRDRQFYRIVTQN